MAQARYTKSHEWCVLQDGVATCGITQHAADELNDLTFLDFRAQAGDTLAQGDVFGEIDSVKATSELFAPVSGTVEAINERFTNEDELPVINQSPEDEGWLIKLKASDPAQFEQLLDAEAYKQHCAE